MKIETVDIINILKKEIVLDGPLCDDTRMTKEYAEGYADGLKDGDTDGMLRCVNILKAIEEKGPSSHQGPFQGSRIWHEERLLRPRGRHG